jgi:ankyrin repeat protein
MQGGWTALIFAAYNGHLKTVEELLKRGADADAKDMVMQGDGVGVGVGNEG